MISIARANTMRLRMKAEILPLFSLILIFSFRVKYDAQARVSPNPKRSRHGEHIKYISSTTSSEEKWQWGLQMDQSEPAVKVPNRNERALNSMSLSLSFQIFDTPSAPPMAKPTHIPSQDRTSQNNTISTPTSSPISSTSSSVPTTYWPTYSPTEVLLNNEPASSFYFFAMGDVPDFKPSSTNSKRQNQLLYEIPAELKKLSTYDGQFLVHLGDIQSGNLDKETGLPQGPCPESMFQEIATAFEHSPIPTFFVPGDHAWIECENAEEAHGYWIEYLFRYNERHINPPLGSKVYRSHQNPELFSFLLYDVLFIGQGLPGPSKMTTNAWREYINGTEMTRDWYMTANIRWLKRSVFRNKSKMKAIVIFAHAADTKPNSEFSSKLAEVASKYYNIPILVLEEKEGLDIEENFLDQRNLIKLQVGNSVTPTAITVNVTETMNITDVFRYGIS